MDRIFGLATEYWIRPPPRTYPQTGLFSRLLVASRGSGCPSTYYYIHYVAELPGCALLTYMQGLGFRMGLARYGVQIRAFMSRVTVD